MGLICLAAYFFSFLWTPPASTYAQRQTQNYWRHSAAREIENVIVSDVDHDGVDELIVITETGRVELVSADGVLQWSFRSDAGDSVDVLNTLNIDTTAYTPQEIALVAGNYLLLLDHEGNEQWRIPFYTAVTPDTIFTTGGLETEADWRERNQIQTIDLQPFDHDGDGQDEILLLLNNGQILLFNREGEQIWQYTNEVSITTAVRPHMAAADLNRDNIPEVVFGFYNPERRFSELTVIGSDGTPQWSRSQPISGRITAVTTVPFSPDGSLQIGVSTDRGEIHLYSHRNERLWWPRTLNKPVTALVHASLPEGPALIAGTNVGSVVAYSAAGQRFWTRHLDAEADSPVLALSAAPFLPGENEPTLAVILRANATSGRPNDVLLLSGDGRTLDTYEAADTSDLTQLLDINRDQNSELLQVRFATLELLGIGKGTSEIASEWTYPLDAAPSSMLVVDFDQDGKEELLVGARDGRLHYLRNRASADWIVAPGGDIAHLAAMHSTEPAISPQIVIARNNISSEDAQPTEQSWLELRTTNGERLWEVPLTSSISSLLVHNIDQRGTSEIVIGTSDGKILAFTSEGELLWEIDIYASESRGERAPVQHLHITQNMQTELPQIVAATPHQVFRISNQFFLAATLIATYEDPIQDVFTLNYQPGQELATVMLLFTDSQISGLTWRGLEMAHWPLPVDAIPRISIAANDIIEEAFENRPVESFLTASSNNSLMRLNVENNAPTIDWELPDVENVTSLYWGDLDGDALPEFIVGGDEGNSGQVRLYSYQQELIDEIPLASGVFGINLLHQEADQKADLLVVSENGDIQLLRTQENRPPLLTNPTTEVTEGQYSVSIAVADVEGDSVEITLETKDMESGAWVSQEALVAPTGNERLFWLVRNLPQNDEGVAYRFFFDDGSHQGYVTPVIGPPPIRAGNLLGIDPGFYIVTAIVAVAVVVIFLRQTQLPAVRANRFYRRLKGNPSQTLLLLENRYLRTYDSPDLLLYLASTARQDNNRILSNLVDGLYLLSDRPYVALPIINGSLENAQKASIRWYDIDRWLLTFNTGQALLEAPTITDLSLLRPQMIALLETLEEEDHWSPPLGLLLPVLTNLRDSERVTQPDDRLVYLTEAAKRLEALKFQLPEFSPRMEKVLAAALAHRWSSLVNAETEELRGRAQLHITLKSKRIVPSEATLISLEVGNHGHAPAENILIALDENPAYTVLSKPQDIEFLPANSTQQINFNIIPRVTDRFRVGVTATFDDRNQHQKIVQFGDMVHLLLPVRDFRPINNPYLPGTPLRSSSTIFYGREPLFNFIADNAGGWSQRNVLILIGQRRTGKTSLLLRLEKHLPDNLLPVYIDCQSLGVVPGMANFFHDLAWLISDSLAMREIDLGVPELSAWEADPTGLFQRHLIPKAQSLLPEKTILLLVFDEFEVFENLVDDGILPPTIFSFLRHLMQHSEGLSFIFVGTRRLEEMSADYWSVLFNIALYARIDYLSEKSAILLITEPVAPDLIYDDLALDKIYRVTAGHPYFLQLVCYTLVKQANDRRTGYVTISDVNNGLDEMLSLGEVHFAYLWQRASFTERAILTAVSHMDADLAFHPEDFIDYLEQVGVYLNPMDVTNALHLLVEKEIMREVAQGAITQYELKIGLVGLWIAKHKSLSKLVTLSPDNLAKNGKSQKAKRPLSHKE